MRYLSFEISNYRAIKRLTVNLDMKLLPIVGVNECGKTTILQAIYAFDHNNDAEYEGRHLKSIKNLYDTVDLESSVSSTILVRTKNIVEVLNLLVSQVAAGTLVVPAGESPFEFVAEKIVKDLGGPER